MKTLLAALGFSLVAPLHAEPQVTNLASLYDEVWQRGAGQSPAERLIDFQKTVVERFPQFYGAQRFQGKTSQEQLEKRWSDSFEHYAALRPAYMNVVAQFDGEMAANLLTFRQAFPSYTLASEIYLVHSLGEFDGALRTFDGKRYLMFGADMIARIHAGDRVTPLFHHELFHEYHRNHFNGCSGNIWPALWREGLATFVSSRLNPSATDSELLLTVPAGMKTNTAKNLPAALADLLAKLDKDDEKDSAALFQSSSQSGAGLPARRGYYLGYLLAEQAGRTRTLDQLARLNCNEARTVVFEGVRALLQDKPAH